MNIIYVICLMMYYDDVMIIYIHNIVNAVRIKNEIHCIIFAFKLFWIICSYKTIIQTMKSLN